MSKTQRIIKALLMILMLFSVFEDITTLNNEKASSNDIDVKAFLAKSDSKIIQFNVTLLKPANAMYFIEISTVTNGSDEYCKQLNGCSRNVDKSSITTIIPFSDDHIVIGREPCDFQNDCTYNVSIHSLFSKEINHNAIYHVPECINSLCACRHEKNLPTPKFTPKINENGQLHIDWEIDSNNRKSLPDGVYIDHLVISIDELRDCDIHWVGERHTYFSEQLHDYGKLRLKGDHTKTFNNTLTGECLFIRMNVVDIKQCFGEIVNATVKIEKDFPVNKKNDLTLQFILISTLGVLVIVSVIMLMLYGYVWWKKKKHILRYWHNIYNNPPNGSDGSHQMIPMRENPLYLMRDSQHEDDIDIPPSAIKEIGKEIGKGAFGRVYVARLGDIPGRFSSQIVAIKKLKRQPNPELLEEFLSEIATMRRAGANKNIVQLLGSCTVNKCLVMIMEYVPCGDLLKYLRNVRAKHEASLRQEMCCANNSTMRQSTSSQALGLRGKYASISHSTSSASETSSYITQPDTFPSSFQVGTASRPSFAETMYTNLTVPSNPELTPMIPSLEYVVDHNELHNFALQIARGMKHLEEKHITHRDLAARNILIDENKTLKISDFGLARDGIYINSKNKKVPFRWLSIEAIKDNLYSSKSDVWSFAIVLWEIGTLGGLPYPSVQNNELLKFLMEGRRLEKPEICSDALYDLMLACWESNRDDRPNFRDICEKLDPKRNRIYIDFSELSPTYIFPTTLEPDCKK